MMEQRRNRKSVFEDESANHQIELDLLGINGVSVDPLALHKLRSAGENLPDPNKMKVVVALFCNSEFCTSTGLSQHLKRVGRKGQKNRHEYGVRWGKRSRSSKIKFDAGDLVLSSEDVSCELWIALTDGKGEDKTCVSFPIGFGTLPFHSMIQSNQITTLDIPVEALVNDSSMDEVWESGDDLQRMQAKVGSIYSFNNTENAAIRVRFQCRRKKSKSKNYKKNANSSPLASSLIVTEDQRNLPVVEDITSDKPPEVAPRRKVKQVQNIHDDKDEVGSKQFVPIETSSLVSESAFTMGGVPTSRLDARKGSGNPSGMHVITDEYGGEDFFAAENVANFSAPQSAFITLHRPVPVTPTESAFATQKRKGKDDTCSTESLTRTPRGSEDKRSLCAVRLRDQITSPLEMGEINPHVDEPSELGDSIAGPRKSRRDRQNTSALARLKSNALVPMDESTAGVPSIERSDIPGVIRAKPPLGLSENDINSIASNISRIIKSKKKKGTTANSKMFPTSMLMSCNAFGSFVNYPLEQVKEEMRENHADDVTLSTIETRNSSQIIPWRDAMRAYAAETTSITEESVSGFPPACGLGKNQQVLWDNQATACNIGKANQCLATIHEAAVKNEKDISWWNDVPQGCV